MYFKISEILISISQIVALITDCSLRTLVSLSFYFIYICIYMHIMWCHVMWYQIPRQRSVFSKDDRVKLYTNQTIVMYIATDTINITKQTEIEQNCQKIQINQFIVKRVVNNY